MPQTPLVATTGRATGSSAARRLRAEGHIPGVLYGRGMTPVSVTVERRDLRVARSGPAGATTVLDLQVDGKSYPAIVKELQRHPIKRNVLHVDFLRVSRDVAIEVEVPIVLHGEADEVLRNNGTVEQTLFHLTVRAKPGSIPNEIGVDVSALAIGDSIRVGDLQLPSGAETDVDAEEAIVIGQAPQAEEPAPTAEGEEGAEGEGEAAEAAAEAGEGDAGGDAGESSEG